MEVHAGVRSYICSECNRTFPSHTALKRHLRSHTGKRAPPLHAAVNESGQLAPGMVGGGGCHRDDQRQMYFCITMGIGGRRGGGSLALSVCAIKMPIASTSRSTVCYPSVPPQHHSPRLWLQTERLPLPLPCPLACSWGGGYLDPSATQAVGICLVCCGSARGLGHAYGGISTRVASSIFELLENSRKLCFTVCV